MADGLVDFVEFAIAVVFAAPVGLLGVIRLTAGDPVVGVALLAVSVGMVAFDRLVLGPREIVADLLRDVASDVLGTGEREEEPVGERES